MVPGGTVRGHEDWLSTGQAADICSVKPDTILKWIKRGKIRAERTVGGHYRVRREDLDPHIVTPQAASEAGPGKPLRCWEFLGRGGAAPEGCHECIVYRSRAAWCFQLVELGREMGHAQRFCAESCESCTYYQQVHGHATRILVVTADETARNALLTEPREDLQVRFASNGYEASAVIHEFRPGFVIVDHDLLRSSDTKLLEDLAADARVPGVRVLLAVEEGKAARVRAAIRSDVLVGVIEKPLEDELIISVVGAFPVVVGPPEERNR